ncbi:hypothetical protein KJS94_15570 [Flavihumibacter rivuli]|uniref:hypothetical protein n=1 Tax=Flavihumibacter rivuli TaxID=2838156 RepID=UPI001BDDD3B9|nr:hypothetical protein [Flavihumibacter rivuli]ULQ56067.1 hypothetical protein KJS94_15570 [Flavihumibacter rivuli]
MRRIVNMTIPKPTRFLLIGCLFFFATARGQSNLLEANSLLKAELMQYKGFLNSFAADGGIVKEMKHFANKVVDSMQHEINKDAALEDSVKIKGINSVRFFLQSLRASLAQKKFELYDVPSAQLEFPLIADALMHGTPFRNFFLGLGPRRTQLMADAFRQFPEGGRFQKLADIRRIAVNPENILGYLEKQKDFPYLDTSLIYVAEQTPMQIVEYVAARQTPLADYLRQMPHPVIQQLVQLAGNRNATELVPFAGRMAVGIITADSVLKLRRSNVTGYFQMLVNCSQENKVRRSQGLPTPMQPAIRTALHEKAMAFYVQPINELHESKDQVRFASIKSLRPVDLYYLITSGEDELYTSSFLGIYRRLMASLPKGHADSLMEWVQYDNFRKFIRITSHYNVLTDYLNNMPEANRTDLLRRFISGIEANTDNGVEEAMDVADAFIGLSNDSAYSNVTKQLLIENLGRCQRENSYYGVRLYTILDQVFTVSNDPKALKDLFAKVGSYEYLPVSTLKDSNGVINQLVIFYGDEDGKTSWQNFLAMFRDTSQWQITKLPNWYEIRSRNAAQPIQIFANLPLDHSNNLDEQAQLAMLNYINGLKATPAIIIHRGHSYHLPSTLNYLNPAIKLAFLGSCGGYKNILTVAYKSPSAQIVATKQIGSKLINDPMIRELNDLLYKGSDINWPELWLTMGQRFSKTPFTRDLFAEYVPPYRNLSLFVIRLYNYDEGIL